MKASYLSQVLIAISLVLLSLASIAGKDKETGETVSAKKIANPIKASPTQDSVISPPSIITSPSSIGEVNFQHEFHYADLEIECETCHHEVDAVKLNIPHKEYFQDFWISCTLCHHETKLIGTKAQACSNCHHAYPTSIADETLSTKVVIHKDCWKCHEPGTGAAASKECKFCHQGPKSGAQNNE